MNEWRIIYVCLCFCIQKKKTQGIHHWWSSNDYVEYIIEWQVFLSFFFFHRSMVIWWLCSLHHWPLSFQVFSFFFFFFLIQQYKYCKSFHFSFHFSSSIRFPTNKQKILILNDVNIKWRWRWRNIHSMQSKPNRSKKKWSTKW